MSEDTTVKIFSAESSTYGRLCPIKPPAEQIVSDYMDSLRLEHVLVDMASYERFVNFCSAPKVLRLVFNGQTSDVKSVELVFSTCAAGDFDDYNRVSRCLAIVRSEYDVEYEGHFSCPAHYDKKGLAEGRKLLSAIGLVEKTDALERFDRVSMVIRGVFFALFKRAKWLAQHMEADKTADADATAALVALVAWITENEICHY